jgi:hypothetical protein
LLPTGSKRLDNMNARYFVVQEGGKTFVGTFETERRRRTLVLIGFTDVKDLYMHKLVSVDIPLGAWWLKQLKRRQYEGLVKMPRPRVRRAVLNTNITNDNFWLTQIAKVASRCTPIPQELLVDSLCLSFNPRGSRQAFDRCKYTEEASRQWWRPRLSPHWSARRLFGRDSRRMGKAINIRKHQPVSQGTLT